MVAEDANDIQSIQSLLLKNFKTIQFKRLLRSLNGTKMLSEKARRAIRAELNSSGCSWIIFIMDLDGLPSQANRIASKKRQFDTLNALCGGNNLLLLNIWELEALIFADIDTFNQKYGTKIKGNRNPMSIAHPKEELISSTYKSKRRFAVSDCPEIFAALDYARVESNCQFFKDFVNVLDEKVNPRKKK